MRYDDRKIHSITVGPFALVQGDQGPLASTTVYIDLTAHGRDDLGGPGIVVNIGVPADGNETLHELRSKAIQLSYEMVQRVARETADALAATADKEPLFSIPKD